jgi:hypothetical protein
MTPVTAPISPVQTAHAAAQKPALKSEGCVHSAKQHVASPAVIPAEPVALRVDMTVATGNLHPNKTHPGLHDWRALERRAFSVRLRGPYGI